MKVYLESLGCARNQVDSEIMTGRLSRAGWSLTQDPAEAHTIIVNTCSFIEDAADESIEVILDLAEFKKNVLEVLRQPMEDGFVTIARALTSITYPARFMLLAAMNPCPCGYFSDTHHDCSCSFSSIHRYRSKVSGPLMDRIDIHVDVPAVRYKDLADVHDSESSVAIRHRVKRARSGQSERFHGRNFFCNAQMSNRHIRNYCTIGQESHRLLETAIDKLGLSARAYNRVLKIARTIADLEGTKDINMHHISEAIQYRSLDRDHLVP